MVTMKFLECPLCKGNKNHILSVKVNAGGEIKPEDVLHFFVSAMLNAGYGANEEKYKYCERYIGFGNR